LTGFGLAVEIGDCHRFTGSTIGIFLGLVPAEHSSPDPDPDPRSPRLGNSHARHLLVEAAWHHRESNHRPGQVMLPRWAPRTVRSTGSRKRRQSATPPTLATIHRPPQEAIVANVAMAPELTGWAWSLAVLH
jgi:hypothetical protein